MKKYLILLFCVLLVIPALAEEPQVLLSGEAENGGYGGPFVRSCSVKGMGGMAIGAEGGWIVNRTFFLGGRAYGLASSFAASNFSSGHAGKLAFGVGGLSLGWIINSDNLTHLVLSTMIGYGSASYDNTDSSNVSVIEPQIDYEINITRFFRLALGISYRLVGGVDNTPGLSNSDLSGFSAGLTFKFGSFSDMVTDMREHMAPFIEPPERK